MEQGHVKGDWALNPAVPHSLPFSSTWVCPPCGTISPPILAPYSPAVNSGGR